MNEVQKQKLLKVREQILAQPELYDQRTWGSGIEPCGSPSCLLGWLAWNENPDPKSFTKFLYEGNNNIFGYDLLGITYGKYYLFGTGFFWPEPYQSKLAIARTKKAKAKAAAAMIDYVIANEEEECRRNIQNKN